MLRSLGLFTLIASAIALAWYGLGRPVAMPPSPLGPEDKLTCISYAPFHGDQAPFTEDLRISDAQIAEDLRRLSALTACVRTYSAKGAQGRITRLAEAQGLTVLQGIWLGRNRADNRREIEAALQLARRHPGTVKALIVGNETLLRGELAPATVGTYLEEVKRRSGLPVTYADVWEFWLKSPELASAADFITIHILPYWEDDPVSAKDAVAHVREVRDRVQATFPGKEIWIGEMGWPSAGRMRAGALPSPANQARVLSDVVAAAKQDGWKVNLIEAFDQPWKRLLEGTVGGYWGVYGDQRREPKFQFRTRAYRTTQTGGSRRDSASAPLFWCLLPSGLDPATPPRARAPGGLTRRLRSSRWASASSSAWPSPTCRWKVKWRATGCARWPCSCWLSWFPRPAPMRLGAAIVLPALPRHSIRRIGAAATSSRSCSPRCLPRRWSPRMHVALGLVFDPRYKDFPFAALAGPVIAFAVLGLATARAPIKPGAAEVAAAMVLTASALFVIANEGIANWQALVLAGLLVLLALTALRAKAAPG